MEQSSAQQKNEEKFVVGVEIGSSCAKIGIAGFMPDDPNHTLTVYNAASVPTVDSVRYGRITNIREVKDKVYELLEKVEKRYPIENRSILGVYISVGGRTLKSRRINARIVLPDRCEITEDMVQRLQDEALQNLDRNKELIYVEPNRFMVDNMPSPRPVGSLGTRLQGDFTAVICDPANKNDIVDVISDRIGLSISGKSVRPIALARLVLSPQEINAGCMLVDFGAETITVAIFKAYTLQYLATIPIGSRLITKDLAEVLARTEEDAEAIKIAMANAIPDHNDVADKAADDRLARAVDAVVGARLRDFIANINAQPDFAGIAKEDLAAGIILTGGGAKLRNFGRLLDARTGMKVRLATLPADIVINDAVMSASDNLDLIALLNEAAEESRLNPDIDCLSAVVAPPVADDKPADGDKTVEPEESRANIVFDITSGQYVDLDREEAEDIIDKRLEKYDYEPSDFTNYGGGSYDYSDEDPDILRDDPDDPDMDLMDDEAVERYRLKKAREKAARAEAERERRDRKKRAEEAERQRIEKKQQQAAAEEERQKNPTRMDRFINRITGILSNNGEDKSGDLDR